MIEQRKQSSWLLRCMYKPHQQPPTRCRSETEALGAHHLQCTRARQTGAGQVTERLAQWICDIEIRTHDLKNM